MGRGSDTGRDIPQPDVQERRGKPCAKKKKKGRNYIIFENALRGMRNGMRKKIAYASNRLS